ncbi:MAG: hypothetical protein Q7T26_04180 [Dehalococcoidia bacterium]|nr:hypothetical protein [Dehalococcoidia bacterium]
MKKPLDKVIPVRLSADVWEALRKEARELGVGPTTAVLGMTGNVGPLMDSTGSPRAGYYLA